MRVNNSTGPSVAALAIALCLTLGAGQEAAALNTPEPPYQQIVPLGVVPFGDVDCDAEVDPVDALRVLRHSAELSVIQTEPCEDIGIDTLPNGEIQGDVDCSNSVNSVDALNILRYTIALSVSQFEPPACPDIGT